MAIASTSIPIDIHQHVREEVLLLPEQCWRSSIPKVSLSLLPERPVPPLNEPLAWRLSTGVWPTLLLALLAAPHE